MIRKIRGIAKLACEFIIEVANTMTKNKITHQEEGTRIAIEVLNPHSVRLEFIIFLGKVVADPSIRKK